MSNESYQESALARPYLRLKSADAPKLGQRGEGRVYFELLTDADRQQLHIQITGNDGSGYVSNERVAFERIEAAIAGIPAGECFPARIFKTAFVGRSANNPGFLSCILRAEGLLAGVPDKAHQHIVTGDWSAWVQATLALPGEPMALDGPTVAAAVVEAVAPVSSSRRKDKRRPNVVEESADAHVPQ